jgi:hypothetical protein
MLASVTRQNGIDSYRYLLHICVEPRSGVEIIDLGVKQVKYSYALVIGGFRCMLIPTESLAEAAAKRYPIGYVQVVQIQPQIYSYS